jgi:2-oxoisovalerate dehydrogenase E2 component (dihydrolipoyl transacylase)
MPEPITMPQLGESVTEGTITRWLKAEGDEVEQDEPLAEVDTDKVNAELPSPLAGKVEKLLVPEGTTVDVGSEIALVAVNGVEHPSAEAPPRGDAAAEAPTEEWSVAGTEAQPPVGVAEARAGGGHDGYGDVQVETADGVRMRRSSPIVRRLAAEHGVEISEIPGTGIGGRVTKRDVEGFVKDRKTAPQADVQTEAATGSERRQEPERERAPVYEGDRVEEVVGIRRAIASRMALSKGEIPHAWTLVEVDVTGLVALREREKAAFALREGVGLTYLPFIVKAAAEGLKENPTLNSVWDGDRIVLRKKVNVGVAVDLGDALIVPVVHGADELSLVGLARQIDDAVKRARNRELGAQDVSGGTFTVNNPGSLGSVASTPIINHPQAAILQAEAIVKRPVVLDGPAGEAIAIRHMMNLEVSFDHRVLDGGAALRFLTAVKRRLEAYGPGSAMS